MIDNQCGNNDMGIKDSQRAHSLFCFFEQIILFFLHAVRLSMKYEKQKHITKGRIFCVLSAFICKYNKSIMYDNKAREKDLKMLFLGILFLC